MTAQRRLVSDSEIKRVFALAGAQGLDVAACGLEVGPDYVLILPPSNGGGELAQWINRAPHSPKKG